MKCAKCGGEVLAHTIDDHTEEYPERIVGDIECISVNHEANEKWYVCTKCKAYHLECPGCSVYCNLVGFPGERVADGAQYCIVDDEYKIFNGDFYETFAKGYIAIPFELKYLDASTWFPTGADGSKFTKWKCAECEYKVKCFD